MSAKGAAPGPWSVVDNRDMTGTYWIEAMHPEGFAVSIAEVRQGCGEADDISTVEANAALMAAAPDLLAALKDLLEAIGGEDSTDMFCVAARAALAKAGAAP